MNAVDVVVVGGGVIGSAVSYYLTQKGFDVALVERTYLAGTGSASGACAGGVRCQGRAEAELPMAIAGQGLWTYLEDELGSEIEYRRCGHITVVEDDESFTALSRSVARQRELGLWIELLDQDELRELVPGIAASMIGGAYCPTDGQANPILTTRALARAAQRMGARLLLGTNVTGITCKAGKVTGVATTAGEIGCAWVVNAAGAWSNEINAMVGIDLPMKWGAPQMMVSERMPRMLTPVLGCASRTISLKQSPGGSFIVGGGWLTEWARDERRVSLKYTSIVGSANAIVSLMPMLGDICLIRVWGGFENYCPDDLPILGLAPEPEGFVLATGFSGHGFALAPIVGKAIAESITEGRDSPLIGSLSWKRFWEGEVS